jgi:hypothetical protein
MEGPKFLKICQDTKFDMGFQKKNMRSRNSSIDFFLIVRVSHLVRLKQFCVKKYFEIRVKIYEHMLLVQTKLTGE